MLVHGTGDEDRREERKHVGLQNGDQEFQQANTNLTKQAANRDDAPEGHRTLCRSCDEAEDHAESSMATHDIAEKSHRKDQMFNEKPESLDDEHQSPDGDATESGHARIGYQVTEKSAKSQRLHAVCRRGNESTEGKGTGDVDIAGG